MVPDIAQPGLPIAAAEIHDIQQCQRSHTFGEKMSGRDREGESFGAGRRDDA
jgi:hypothetical protein